MIIKKIKEIYPLVLMFSVIFIIKYFDNKLDSIILTLLFSVSVFILLVYLYFMLKQKYDNLRLIFSMITLIIIVFPLIHMSIFRLNKNNYSFNQDFLTYKRYLINQELTDYKGHELLEDFLNTASDSILNSQLLNSQYYIFSNVGNFKLKIITQEGLRRPSDRENDNGLTNRTVILTSTLDNNKTTFNISDETLKSAIQAKLHKRRGLISLMKTPIKTIRYKDIWLECFTGFLLGNIKPISLFAQTIQSLQVFVFFITVTILGTFISNNTNWIPKKRNI